MIRDINKYVEIIISDKKLLESSEKTSLPHCIQIFGGETDKEDIINNKIEVENLVFLDTKNALIELNNMTNPIREYVKEIL